MPLLSTIHLFMKVIRAQSKKNGNHQGLPDNRLKAFNDRMEDSWGFMMKAIGLCLTFLFLGLLGIVSYGWFADQCRIYYLLYESYLLASVMVAVGGFLVFNIGFNYFMAIFTSSLSTKSLLIELTTTTIIPNQDENSRFDLEIEKIDADDRLDDDKELGYSIKTCEKCKLPKPYRAHHCSVCRKCVLKMDHHCPWINNCVGYNNQRYFLLMLFWLLIGTLVYNLFNLTLLKILHSSTKLYERSPLFIINTFIAGVIAIVLVPFNAWSWYLACTNQTTIEFWQKKTQKRKYGYVEDKDDKLTYAKILKNLEIVFGTDILWKILMPSVRMLKSNGCFNKPNHVGRTV